MVFEVYKACSKSDVWKHFLFDYKTKEAKCVHCGKVLKATGSSTSGLCRHFENFYKRLENVQVSGNSQENESKDKKYIFCQKTKTKLSLDEEVRHLCVKNQLSFNQISSSKGIRKSFKALGYDIPRSHKGSVICMAHNVQKAIKDILYKKYESSR